eukprot:TRINITY_DN21886_c0_g1_i2.p2 TRINITY_DN21886_c0_g1~~TRINITY_DN21886_c0_g1_i2.p2  ORF type:complete len:203 (+),score=38.49 TRINITY_DN21886_c0_g1_i2:128-736(+)
MRLYQLYKRMIDRAPLATRVVTGSALAVAGDVTAQTIERSRCPADFDMRRTLSFGGLGIWWTGMFQHNWLPFLARCFPGTGLQPVLTKMCLTQFGANAGFYVPAFYLWNGKLRHGSSNDEIWAKLEAEYWDTCLKMWSIWMPSNLVMFVYVPVSMQVLWIAGVNFLWNTLISLMYNADQVKAEVPAALVAPPATAGLAEAQT